MRLRLRACLARRWGWKSTADAIAGQLRDAGSSIHRTVHPSSTFWNDRAKYPFSVTNWNHRPFGIRTHALACESRVSRNETGFAKAESDALVDEALGIADHDERRGIMARLQQMVIDEGARSSPTGAGLSTTRNSP